MSWIQKTIIEDNNFRLIGKKWRGKQGLLLEDKTVAFDMKDSKKKATWVYLGRDFLSNLVGRDDGFRDVIDGLDRYHGLTFDIKGDNIMIKSIQHSRAIEVPKTTLIEAWDELMSDDYTEESSPEAEPAMPMDD
ncbi:MAG: hypothetical protein O7B35_11405 [Deltaproteobacteria bacterium]|nr:hypothetical protein [Deltaproteobacteria bacterium]